VKTNRDFTTALVLLLAAAFALMWSPLLGQLDGAAAPPPSLTIH
jgi:hypothetical protein